MSNHNAKSRFAFTLAEVFSPHPTSPQRAAFTLAEVLITLGIIGVVAAMTLPILVGNYKKQATVSKLKKSYTILNQAFQQSINDNGEFDTWDFDYTNNYDGTDMKFFKKYFLPYLKVAKDYKLTGGIKNINDVDAINPLKWVLLSDGTGLTIFYNLPTSYIWMFSDINGPAKPNCLGKDIFMYEIYRNKKVVLWGNDVFGSRNNVVTDLGYGCNKQANVKYQGGYCGALIQYDEWKIKGDYPW